jgi:hypothetical protein
LTFRFVELSISQDVVLLASPLNDLQMNFYFNIILVIAENEGNNKFNLFQVKANNKMKLAQYLEETTGIVINPSSMFDIQVKISNSISCPSKLLPRSVPLCNFFTRTTDWIFLVEFLVMKNYLEYHLLTWFSKISSPPKLSR